MAENQRAFNQVRAILDKLDRSIDRARDRRLHGDRPPPQEVSPEPTGAGHSRPAKPEAPSQPPISSVSPQRPGSSKYGKARPLRQPPHPGEANGSAWRRP